MYTRSPHLSSAHGVRRMGLCMTVRRYAIVCVAAFLIAAGATLAHQQQAGTQPATAPAAPPPPSAAQKPAAKPAQPSAAPAAAKPNETQAEEFARLVKEWSTGPEFISPLV